MTDRRISSTFLPRPSQQAVRTKTKSAQFTVGARNCSRRDLAPCPSAVPVRSSDLHSQIMCAETIPPPPAPAPFCNGIDSRASSRHVVFARGKKPEINTAAAGELLRPPADWSRRRTRLQAQHELRAKLQGRNRAECFGFGENESFFGGKHCCHLPGKNKNCTMMHLLT